MHPSRALILLSIVSLGTPGCSDWLKPTPPLNIVDFPPRSRVRALRPKDYFADDGQIAMAYAVQSDDLAEIDRLLATGVNVNAVGKDRVSMLTWAMLNERKASFERLLKKGADPNHLVLGDCPLVWIAARNNDSTWLELLLRFKANPSLISGRDRDVALTAAIYYPSGDGNIRNIDLLVRAKADLNHQDHLGCTPMIRCLMHNRYDLAYRLLESGADWRIKDKKGRDVMYDVIISEFKPGTEGWGWREKFIDLLL